MTRALLLVPALLAMPLGTASCYSGVGALHDIHVDAARGEWAWCLSPGGEDWRTHSVRWTGEFDNDWASEGRDAMGRTYGTCTPPNRFVHVYACAPGQADAGESPAALAARA